MPYIKQKDREKLFDAPSNTILHLDNIDTAGEIQCAIAVMLKSFMDRKGLNYQNCNDVMGALAGAQMEFYRRVVAPLEDIKIEENGDI